MVRKIFNLVVVLLVANAIYRVAPSVVRYQKFKQDAQAIALASKEATDATIIQQVMELAAERKVPLERDWITVRRSKDRMHTYIDATWVEELAVIPGWKYTWVVEVTADGWHIKPATLDGAR